MNIIEPIPQTTEPDNDQVTSDTGAATPETPSPELVVQHPSRPFTVTILCLGVLILSALSLARFGLALRYWDYLDELTTVSPWYLALSGLVWVLSGLPLAWGLFRGKGWAPGLMRAMALSYAAYYWLDHVFLQDHPLTGAEGNARLLLPDSWKFEVGLTVVLLALTTWVLNRQKTRLFFGDVNEQQPKDETPA